MNRLSLGLSVEGVPVGYGVWGSVRPPFGERRRVGVDATILKVGMSWLRLCRSLHRVGVA